MVCFVAIEGMVGAPAGAAGAKVALTRVTDCAALEVVACSFSAAMAFFSAAAATLLDAARVLGGMMRVEI